MPTLKDILNKPGLSVTVFEKFKTIAINSCKEQIIKLPFDQNNPFNLRGREIVSELEKKIVGYRVGLSPDLLEQQMSLASKDSEQD